MNTSKALKRLLLLLFLSFSGSAYTHKPAAAHTHTDEIKLLEKLRARPEYRELAEHFSLVANQHTRTGKNVPSKTRRHALISCMTTLEKLEETYPSPLLTDVATWCSTEFKQRKKLAPWMRNAIIIGSSAAAAALALAAIWYGHKTYRIQKFNSLSYKEQLEYAIANQQAKPRLYQDALTLRTVYRNPGSSQKDLESALAEALLASPANPSLIAVIRNLLPDDAQEKVNEQVARMKGKYPSPEKQNLLSTLFSLRFQMSKHTKLIQDATENLQKEPDPDRRAHIQTQIDHLRAALKFFKEQEKQAQQQLQSAE
ncbi:MAG: hypothetical protein WCJ17_02035 [bacterium]